MASVHRSVGVVVKHVDASLERTRVSWEVPGMMYCQDVLTFKGFVPIVPGARLRVTVVVVADDASELREREE